MNSVNLPDEIRATVETVVYRDTEELVALHGEAARDAILKTKAMLVEMSLEHLEYLKPVLAMVWAQGAARVVNRNRAAKLVTPTDNPYIEQEAQ